MSFLRTWFFVALNLIAVELAAADQVTAGRGRSFDANWLFSHGDPAGTEKSAFSDSAWRALDLPHDWSIEGPIDRRNSTGPRGGFLPAGIGWYRKHFTLDAADAGKHVLVQFDGVMANSNVYINGFHLGHRPYGWVTFQYDLTGHVSFGPERPNVLAVRVDNSRQPASRFYEGAGIYRHVWISIVDPVHVAPGGVYVTTPSVAADEATVKIGITIENRSAADRDVTVRARVAPTESGWHVPELAKGVASPPNHALRRPAAQVPRLRDVPPPKLGDVPPSAAEIAAAPATTTVRAGKTAELACSCVIRKPELWDPDRPHLYRATVELISDGRAIDSQTVCFGIRQAVFRADTGFWLNGRNVKLLGACVHSEGGAFGTAVPDSEWERRLAALKSLGVNAIRTAHNPPSPDFLDICDRMGLLVMDEMFDVWTVGKYDDQDYHLNFRDWWRQDVTDTVLRDRNHPSVVIYSAGNEIHDNLASSPGQQQFTAIRDAFHRLDPSRPVTMAILQPVEHKIFSSGFADLMDVVGVNYRDSELLSAHRARPNYKILGTENGHGRLAWLALRDSPAYAGQFLWTGIGYLGEARAWPGIAADFGLLDRCGSVKPLGYQRASWWSAKPMVYIARGGINVGRRGRVGGQRRDNGSVNVYSNCQKVELFLNGQSLGTMTKPADNSPRIWQLTGTPPASGYPATAAFEPTLKAIGSSDGKTVATHEVRPAGPAAKLLLAADVAALPHDFDNVAAVRVTIVDAEGNPIAAANPLVTFKVSGSGEIAAIDNAAADSHEGFRGSRIHASGGQCYAWIRSTTDSGSIVFTASSPGLADGTASFTARPPRR